MAENVDITIMNISHYSYGVLWCGDGIIFKFPILSQLDVDLNKFVCFD